MSKKMKDVISIIIAIIGIAFFGGFAIGIWAYALINLSFPTVLGAVFGSLIPGIIAYSIACVLIEFVKENFFNKKR